MLVFHAKTLEALMVDPRLLLKLVPSDSQLSNLRLGTSVLESFGVGPPLPLPTWDPPLPSLNTSWHLSAMSVYYYAMSSLAMLRAKTFHEWSPISVTLSTTLYLERDLAS